MLKTWIPGTIDTRDQGLVATSWTNSGVTVVDSGKIGKCLSSTGSSQVIYTTNYTLSEKWSYSLWWKDNNTSAGWQYIVLLHNGTANDSNAQMAFLSYPADNRCEVCSNGKWHSTIRYTPGTWNHIAGTYDGTTCKCYLNGELYGSFTPGQTKTSTNMRIMHSCNCYVNDLRIWDGDVLSTKEVKEIAKGLVVHYPLSRPLPNLIADFDTSFQSYADGTVTLFTNQMNGGTQEIVSNIAGASKCLHLRSEGSSNRQYRTIAVSANKSYTVSVDYYSTVAQPTSSRGELNGGNYSWLGSAASYTTPGQWQRISYTYTSLTSDATLFFFIYCSQGTDCYVKNFKVEEGTVATPWIPNASDSKYSVMGYNNNIEYDCSGYKNNGTRVGTFSWSNDTPRYNSSLVFSGSQYIVEPNEITTTDSTIALWVKSSLRNEAHILDARNDSGVGKQPIYQYTDGNIQTGGSAAYVVSNVGLLVANTWVHVALVQSGNSLLIYKNGNLFQTISCTNSPVIKPTLGARFNFVNIFNGQLSDFRIYATALSAEAIKELYDTPVSITDNGTMLTQGEFVES